MALAGGKRVGRALVRTEACAGGEKVARSSSPPWPSLLASRSPACRRLRVSALSFRSRLGTSVS